MVLFRNKYRIESTRLKGWDYSSAGYYHITICTKNREYLFGEIIDGNMILNELGEIVQSVWIGLPGHYHNITLDEFIAMPNHVHGIIIIGNGNIVTETGLDVETGLKPVSTDICMNTQKKCSLSEIIRGFKTFSAKNINLLRKTPGSPVWQTRFYDRIIRNEKELYNVRNYININPLKWEYDDYYHGKTNK